MGWFGDLELGAKYGIVFGSLVVLVFTAGFLKLLYIRRQAKKYNEEAKAKAANEEGKTEQIALNQREEDEGDLFGIRALERGFTGGVAQSRPTTPNTAANRSTSTLVPSAVNIPFGQKSAGSLAGSSRSETNSASTIEVGNPKGVTMSNGRTSPGGGGVAVDMNMNVPESPRMTRSPDFSKAPSVYSAQSSPTLGPVSGVAIPSGGLGMQFGQDGTVSPRMHAKAPTKVVTGSSLGMTAPSDSASIVDESDRTPTLSRSSSKYSTTSNIGGSANYGNRPDSPSAPQRSYQGHNPSIRVDGPGHPCEFLPSYPC
ncbi:hypothetical protein L873DRAFT_1663679 [Choiromyces venosus 120613-1]|uniref:Uncharacterized protein n=1 Tax=Choiromyces venosus 120613-1 TaxID=1336337 RepID=A0A3N4K3P6_9PEZI|nr:hypothetical protein L873DRAFT_1663679 [Choiromyces venosus 120613-1]